MYAKITFISLTVLLVSNLLIPMLDVYAITTFVDSFDIGNQDTNARDLAFSSDGTKMFVVGNTGDDINEYTLTTAFDVSTASFVDSFSVNGQDLTPIGLAFNNDGTRMFVVGQTNDRVFQYTLTTGFDVSTAAYSGNSFSVAGQDGTPFGLAFSSDGTKMFVTGDDGNDINEYTLDTAFDLSDTVTFVDSFSVADQDTAPRGVEFSSDGTKMFVVGAGGSDINQYTLTTAFDVSTASFVNSFSVSSQDTSPTNVVFSSNGLKMFVLGNDNDDVYEYTLEVAFDLFSSPTTKSGGHTCADCDPPTFSLDKFAFSKSFPEFVLETIQDDPYTPIVPIRDPTVDLPLVINDNGYAILHYTNTIQTNTIETGEPVNIQLNLADETGIEYVALYTNLRDDKRELQDSDTWIIFEEYEAIQMQDPHGFFSFANVTFYENSTKYSVSFNVTFARPMEKSDIIFRIWDDRRNAADTKILDALEVAQSENIKDTAQNVAKESQAANPVTEKQQIEVIKMWSGYVPQESATDSEVLGMLGLDGQDMPHWVKRFFGESIHRGQLEIKDLKIALDYLIKIGVVR